MPAMAPQLGARPRPAALRRAHHLAPAALMAAVAVMAVGLPRAGLAPELPPAWRLQPSLSAVADSVQTPQPPAEVQSPRKRVAALPERPARRIDDEVRRRAIEAVERALATQDESPA